MRKQFVNYKSTVENLARPYVVEPIREKDRIYVNLVLAKSAFGLGQVYDDPMYSGPILYVYCLQGAAKFLRVLTLSHTPVILHPRIAFVC